VPYYKVQRNKNNNNQLSPIYTHKIIHISLQKKMAGLGRRTHYRKHLTDSILYDFPEPTDNERIAKVVATRGSNQFDVLLAATEGGSTSSEKPQLAILPTKFNKLVWVKRNDFVIVETATDGSEEQTDPQQQPTKSTSADTHASGGIRYMISHILYKNQVKHLQSKGFWPIKDKEFATDKIGLRSAEEAVQKDDEDDQEEEHDGGGVEDDGIVYDMGLGDDFLVNTNRLATLKVDDSSDSDSSDE
jgi:probable RNA-binding protein EIF1AD